MKKLGSGIKRWILLQREFLLWGGNYREKLLLFFLSGYYRSSLLRDWGLRKEQPHFYSQRAGFFLAGFGSRNENGLLPFLRGYYNMEILRPSDRVLDIGCGDGFFTRVFFAPCCTSIDALDIEKSAIATANRYYADSKIRFLEANAVTTPFPQQDYDVIIWDGALGHFDKASSDTMLGKIVASLKPDGLFTGSESIGTEGHDHLQFFHSLDDLIVVLRAHFKHVAVRSHRYPIAGGYMRTEAYWRCSQEKNRLQDVTWKTNNR